ncbi:MAG: 1-acyl-sn-glycerol-3-phosphate acyltransferase [Verrucomicrobiales bacterium]|jgi:1-acyl-sn-glycerol-3-phosphate acyltransferase|nr:1-acyl-sn-glycerol-3-phosphate acyltransferase [Verrucomicrobiales bacterium]
MILRQTGKFLLFVIYTLTASVTGFLTRRRAAWTQRWAQRYARLLNLTVTVSGGIPRRGLVAANHLGYLDILVIASVMPCAFVSKHEVRRWPLLGRLATHANTVFLNRAHIRDLAPAVAQMKHRLAQKLPLVLFPEGTSSDGLRILPFRPSLLQPACELAAPLTATHLSYQLDRGSVPDEVCYWGDMTLLPHLWNLLGKPAIRAQVRFAPPSAPAGDRKQLAARLHAEVSRLSLNIRE